MILCTIHIRKINIHTIFHRFNFDLDPTQSTQLLFVSPKRKEDSALAMSKDQASSFPQKSSILVKGVQYMFIDNPKQKTPNPKLKDTIIECSMFIFKKKGSTLFHYVSLFRSPKLTRTERNFNMKIFVVSRCFNKNVRPGFPASTREHSVSKRLSHLRVKGPVQSPIFWRWWRNINVKPKAAKM